MNSLSDFITSSKEDSLHQFDLKQKEGAEVIMVWDVIVQSGQSKGVPMMQDSMAMAWRRSMRIQLLTSPYSLFSSFFTVLYLSSPSMLNAQWQFLFSSSSDSFKSYADSFCIISSSAFSRLLWRAFLMDSHSSYLRSARLKLFLFSSSLSSRASSWLFKLESSLLSLAISSSSLSFSILHSMFQSCSRSISLRNALFSTYSSPMRALSWLILFSRSKFSSLVAMYLWMSMSLYFLSGLSMVASLWRCGVVLMLLAVGGQLRGYSSTVCTAWCLKEGARWSWSHYSFLMACRYWMQSLRISQSQQLSVNCLTQQPISSRVTPISLLTYTTKFSLISINCLFLLIVSSCRCSCHFFSACFRVSNSSVIAGQALRRRSRTDVIALQCWACLEDWEGCLRCLRQESSSGKEGEGACFLRVFSNI